MKFLLFCIINIDSAKPAANPKATFIIQYRFRKRIAADGGLNTRNIIVSRKIHISGFGIPVAIGQTIVCGNPEFIIFCNAYAPDLIIRCKVYLVAPVFKL